MRVFEFLHENYILDRRIQKLSEQLSVLIPPNAYVLDVGAGDGRLSQKIKELRPDLGLRGIDVLLRTKSYIEIEPFNGRELPFDDRSFDVVLLSDTLHHTEDALQLLREAIRVSRGCLLIKDHLQDGLFANETLRFMDIVGNRRFGVSLNCTYWPRSRWNEVFAQLKLEVRAFKTELGLYPWPFTFIFDRSLHFIARLDVTIPMPT